MADKVGTHYLGASAESYFASVCLKQGLDIAKPVLDVGYDYLVKYKGNWQQVQVKHGSRRNGKSRSTSFSFRPTPRRKTSYQGVVDYFAFVSSEGHIWVVPYNVVANSKSIDIHPGLDIWAGYLLKEG
ncbi:PfWMP3_29 [Phormidium phage Pf-WMP3]|uniref:PfWMP3_29 n=1 Tax=Phormidium phage Pf-WMP3 TaxID=2914005 RepID=A5HL23_9CAUD|nr:PfWMP3_29 [Phormidium phage Pf-WMP3]ABQ12469.1 PfWMP3_29 [Phormidium phage Pf-WMP3]